MADISQITLNGTTYNIKDAAARGDIAGLESDVAALQANVGHPEVITDASEFANADHDKVYAYMGTSITGSYTNGHWYYYKNNTWTDGGVWGSAIAVDNKLETEGAAADAEATGAAIGKLKSALNKVTEVIEEPVQVAYQNKATIDTAGKIIALSASATQDYAVYYAPVKEGETYTVTQHDILTNLTCAFYNVLPALNAVSYNGARTVQESGIIVAPIDGWIAFRSIQNDTGARVSYTTANDKKSREDINTLSAKITTVESTVDGAGFVEQGGYYTSTGGKAVTSKEIRSIGYLGDGVQSVEIDATCPLPIKIMLLAWEETEYVGTWKTTTQTFSVQGFAESMLLSEIDLNSFRASYPQYDFKIGIRTSTNDQDLPVNTYESYILFSIDNIVLLKEKTNDIDNQISTLDNNTSKRWEKCKVKSIAHRGSNVAPENTLAGFKQAVKNGFDYLETDLAFTSDGVPVLLHDSSINRTARNVDGTTLSETVYIYDITYEEALTYDFGIWKGSQYAGEKIPTLDEFLTFCRSTGVKPYLELKYNEHYPYSAITHIADHFKKYDLYKEATIISFIHGYLDEVKSLYPDMRLGVLTSDVDATAIEYAVSLVTASNEVFIDTGNITTVMIEACIEQKLPVEMWTLASANAIIAADVYISGMTCDDINPAQILFNSMMG